MASKEKLLDSAQKFIAKGQTAKAISEYQKLVDAFPKDFRFQQKLAELLTKERRNEEAQPHYEAVAKNFTETGFYLKAIAIYKQMQKVEPNRADLYLRLAELNEKHGLTGNALTEYRTLIAFYEKNKQLKEAVPVLQKMIALDPENLGVRGKLIETLCASYDEAAAREQFRTLVEQLVAKDEHGKVVKLYEKFHELCPDTVEERLPLARALLATDQASKALALLKGLLKQTPEHDELLGVLIDGHLAVGAHEDARLTCQHLLKNQPDNLAMRERYVRICLAAGDYQRAHASLEEWQAAFSQAGQAVLLKELFAAVQAGLPDQPQSQAALAAMAYDIEESLPQPSPPEAGEVDAAPAPVPAVALIEVAESPAKAAESPIKTVTPPTKPGGGLELELDLDLDFDLGPAPVPVPQPQAVEPVSPPPPQALAAPIAPAVSVAPASVVESAGGLELELELDGLDELVFESVEVAAPAPVEPPAPTDELELGIDFEDEAAEPLGAVAVEAVQPDAAAPAELDLELEMELEIEPQVEPEPETTELLLPDLGEFDLVMEVEEIEETAPAEVAAVVAAPEVPVAAETEFAAEVLPTPVVEPEEVAEAEESVEILDDLEELEDVEELEEVEAVEELVGAEPLEELAELEELEECEPLEELPEVVALAVAPPSAVLLNEGLEEAEFYLRQGLFDDAERVAGDLRRDFADHPEVVAKLAEIAAQRQAASTAEEPAAVANPFADIKDDELFGGAELAEETEASIDEFSLEAPADAEDEDEDLQSHFDLGIAYKEMGLLDDAVAEFDRASRDPSRRLDCLTLKGQCQIEMGQAPAAETTYRQALDLPLLNEEGRMVLCYELGLLYELLGRKREALDNYQLVADMDLFFRDVTDKLKVLRQDLGIDDHAIEAVSEGGGGRDRISFV